MARVFISYRRADGQYAVGWIEERLRQLDEVTDLRTAFRDSDLRHGDDFPARLANEVEECDVLIAVIGPKWHGERPDGTARILDPTDWVGREITSALANGKRIIPVLLTGVEPVQASDLHPDHKDFADLHALRFDVAEDLDVLVDDLRSHLGDLDRERARTAGLDAPITLPSARPKLAVMLLAAAAAADGTLIGWATAGFAGELDNRAWFWLTILSFGLYAFLSVLGFAQYRTWLSDVVELRWRTVLVTAAQALVLILLVVFAFAFGDDTLDEKARSLVGALVVVTLLSPWIVMILSAGWSRTMPEGLGDRATVIALQRRAMSIASPVTALAFTPPILTTAALANAEDGLASTEAFGLLGMGILLSLVVVGFLEYGHASLRHDSDLLRAEIAGLAPAHRKHADAVLVDGRADLWRRTVWWGVVPVLVALGSAIYGWTS